MDTSAEFVRALGYEAMVGCIRERSPNEDMIVSVNRKLMCVFDIGKRRRWQGEVGARRQGSAKFAKCG